MINILVRLSVKDFDLFETFEKQAAMIMSKYDGRIISAFEIARNPDGSGEEIHILEFPNEDTFNRYRADAELAKLSELRQQAIAGTEVQMNLCIKTYI